MCLIRVTLDIDFCAHNLEQAAKWIAEFVPPEGTNLMAFTGAGISAESGVPTYY